MKCPICSTRTGIEIDMHADGYADNLLECTRCGTMWIESFEEKILLNNKVA
ncbi:hypothetical protein [Geobacter sp.]|uniref:hypothetical protein n=1 Tax=Geobacter sp. TaxID=46610 RepID=UPI00262E5DC6|nr:hypothetical protein [Geobacter sp.]